MINLLNPDSLKEIRAARLNIRLRRFAVLTLLIAVGIGGIYGVGFWLANHEKAVAQEQHDAALVKLQQYANVKTDAEAYRQNLATASKILSGEIVFSNFLIDTAQLLPPNTILSSLHLSTTANSSKPGELSLEARGKSYADILALKGRLQSDASIFTDVRITSTGKIDESTASTIEEKYPFWATFTVILKKLASAGGVQ